MSGVEITDNGTEKWVVIEGTSVSTSVVREAFMGGADIDDLAAEHDLDRTQVEAALRYECCATCKCDECGWARELRAKAEGGV